MPNGIIVGGPQRDAIAVVIDGIALNDIILTPARLSDAINGVIGDSIVPNIVIVAAERQYNAISRIIGDAIAPYGIIT